MFSFGCRCVLPFARRAQLSEIFFSYFRSCAFSSFSAFWQVESQSGFIFLKRNRGVREKSGISFITFVRRGDKWSNYIRPLSRDNSRKNCKKPAAQNLKWKSPFNQSYARQVLRSFSVRESEKRFGFDVTARNFLSFFNFFNWLQPVSREAGEVVMCCCRPTVDDDQKRRLKIWKASKWNLIF